MKEEHNPTELNHPELNTFRRLYEHLKATNNLKKVIDLKFNVMIDKDAMFEPFGSAEFRTYHYVFDLQFIKAKCFEEVEDEVKNIVMNEAVMKEGFYSVSVLENNGFKELPKFIKNLCEIKWKEYIEKERNK